MWDEMGLVRVYTKPQGQQPDFSEPVVLSTVRITPAALSLSLIIFHLHKKGDIF
jgi:ribosome-interacting GTPase 1